MRAELMPSRELSSKTRPFSVWPLNNGSRNERTGGFFDGLNLVADETFHADFAALAPARVKAPEVLQTTAIPLSNGVLEFVGLNKTTVSVVQQFDHSFVTTRSDDGAANARREYTRSRTEGAAALSEGAATGGRSH